MTRHLTHFAISLGVLLLWLLGMFAFREMVETNRSLRATYQMSAIVERMIITTQRTEATFEGYALTGSPDLLNQWEANRAAFGAYASRLERLLAQADEDPVIAAEARQAFEEWVEMQQNTRIFGAPPAEREELVAGLLANSNDLLMLRAAGARSIGQLERLHASLAERLVSATLRTQVLRSRFDWMAGGLAVLSVTFAVLALLLIVRRGRLIREHNEQLRGEAAAREDASREVQRVNRRQRLILDAAANGIIGVSWDGTVVFRNPAAVRMLGEERTAIGARLDGVLATTAPGEAEPLLAPLQDGQPRRALEASFRGAQGDDFPAEYTSVPVPDGDRITGAVITFQDISERLEIDRLKTEFISVVSHELRTPLTSLRGSLGLLASGRMGTLDPSGTRMLEIAVESADRLIHLVNDILDIERLEAGRVTLEIQTVDLLESGRRAVDQLQTLAVDAGVRLTLEGDATEVLADPHRLHQVIVNLISNAVKFSATGQEVVVSVGRDAAGTPLLQVRDSGRGIPPDKLDSVFDRFKQVDSSDARRHGGTGLGLAISRSIIDQHGGRIWAESEPGRGSTFSFVLPEPSSGSAGPGPSAGARPRVLICCWTDEAYGIANVLESAGYAPVKADADDLPAEAARSDPFAILLDITTANAEGVATLERIRSDPATRDIPAIVLADIPPADDLDQDRMVEWINPPFEPEDVVRAVMSACAHRADRQHILIVEDDDELAEVIREGFHRHGIETQRAATGREAITLAYRNPPAVVVLDLMLPEGNGEWVVSWMRQVDKLRDTHLVVFSARDLEESDRQRLTLGQTIFIRKGQMEPGEFERRVVDVFRKVESDSAGDQNENGEGR